MADNQETDRAKIIRFKNKFDTSRRHPRSIDHHRRLNRNHNFFSGLHGGQWFANDAAEADSSDRIRHTLNLIMPSIEQIVGDLMSNPHSVDFVTDDSSYVGDADLMKQLFDADYSLGHFKTAITEYQRDVLIHTGVLQIYPNYSHHSKGNIGLRRVSPLNILTDPFWQTDDTADCGYAFQAPWASIEGIRDLCRANAKTSEAVEFAYKTFQSHGVNTAIDVSEQRRDITSEFYNQESQQFRVIECYYMVSEKVSKVQRNSDKASLGMFSKKELALAKVDELHGHQNGVMYSVIEDTIAVCRVFTFVPGLDDSLVIADGLYPIQMGRLPFIFRSTHNNLGERQGLVDMLIGPQVEINKRESSASEVLDRTARANVEYESDAFGDDSTMERDYADRFMKTGQMLKVAPGALSENKIRKSAPVVAPTDLWSATDRAVAFMDRILGLTAARQGETKSHDSAIMFSDQVAQAEIKMFLLNTGLSDTLEQLGDMYFYGAKDLYVGDTRKILNPKNGKITEINKISIVDGRPVISNEIASLPRFVVRIEQAKHGLTVRKRYLTMYTELGKSVRNPLLAARYELEQVRFLGLPDAKVEQMEEECEIFLLLNKKQMLAQVAQLDLQIAQADQQLKQIKNPTPAPAPTGLAGVPSPVQTPSQSPESGAGMGAPSGGAGMAGAQVQNK